MRERIALDGEPLSEEQFAAVYDEVAPYAELVDGKHPDRVTFYETLVAMAFAAFADAPVDVAVVEVGMGGTLGRLQRHRRRTSQSSCRSGSTTPSGSVTRWSRSRREGRHHQAGRDARHGAPAARGGAGAPGTAVEVGATVAREGLVASRRVTSSLVWSITADETSDSNIPQRLCGALRIGYVHTVYVALRGGGSVYKTSDGGQTWATMATGLPNGAEVYAIAIVPQDNAVLYAGTKSGVYKWTDASGTWTLHGLEGLIVRAMALDPRQTAGSSPMILAGVDGATTMYQRLPTTP